jgi:hypothetical protein
MHAHSEILIHVSLITIPQSPVFIPMHSPGREFDACQFRHRRYSVRHSAPHNPWGNYFDIPTTRRDIVYFVVLGLFLLFSIIFCGQPVK